MKVRTKHRLYSEVNVLKDPSEIDYNHLTLTWGKQENYEILRKIGTGKYSDLYEGLQTESQKKVLIKILKPIRKSKVLREVKVLNTLTNLAGVPRLLDLVKENSTKTPSLIFDYEESQDFLSIVYKIEEIDLKYYLWEILRILDKAHSNGIINRDLKSSNIVVNHSTRVLRVTDWGLADFYLPEKTLNCRVASRYYKSPDLLMGYEKYDYSVDMWAFGVLFASIIFKKHPIFHGHDNYDQLLKIVRMLGTGPFLEYLEKYNIPLDQGFDELRNPYSIKPWQKFVKPDCKLASPEAIDLVSRVLIYDHNERLLASEAMQHSYFAPVREMLEKVSRSEKACQGDDLFSILLSKKLANQ